jgi:hypothetical protein
MEITDVTTIDQLTDAEVDELLARALNPRIPIEVFYAVLDRIGAPVIAADEAPAAQPPEQESDQPLGQDPDTYEDPGPDQFPGYELAEVGGEI